MHDTDRDNTGFDSFDRALLTELRQVAAEGAPAPVRRTRKRWALSAAGLAAAGATAVGFTTLGSSSAYAVDETDSGDIVITIHELDDASGLEDALADHGIEAEVDYDADGFGSEPETDDLELPDGAEVDQAVPGVPPTDGPCGGFDDMPFTTALNSDDYVITIPADSVLLDSDTVLRITTAGDVDAQAAGLEVAYSVGDVDCGFGTASMGVIAD